MKTQVLSYNYNREHIKPGILHIGVGNFHRAHEEFYTNLLLEDPTHRIGVFAVLCYCLEMSACTEY